MIITIAGKPGSGKSTVAKLLAKKLNYQHYSAGDVQRGLAKEHGMDITTWIKYLENHPEFNKKVDERTAQLGKKDNIVVDAHIGWKFIPHSLKVFLDVRPAEASRRIQEAHRQTEAFGTPAAAAKKMAERIASMQKQYKEQYDIALYARKNYDLVIDTTKISPEEVVALILKKLKP